MRMTQQVSMEFIQLPLPGVTPPPRPGVTLQTKTLCLRADREAGAAPSGWAAENGCPRGGGRGPAPPSRLAWGLSQIRSCQGPGSFWGPDEDGDMWKPPARRPQPTAPGRLRPVRTLAERLGLCQAGGRQEEASQLLVALAVCLSLGLLEGSRHIHNFRLSLLFPSGTETQPLSI